VRRIAIFGAGGFAREVLALLRDLARAGEPWEVAGFVDDDPASHGRVLDGVPVAGGRDWLAAQGEPLHLALGVGSPVVKRKVVRSLRDVAAGFPVLVHPNVVRTDYVEYGEGAVVTAGNILTSQIRVGAFAMLNLACTVGHDCVLGDYATVSPGVNVSGHVTLGEGVDVGTGSKLIQGVTVGEWTVIGAGAVVSRDLPANCTAVGVPAKPIKEREPGWHER
jgi:sugar O-acyltransferase (sialic acid O-acetyltransferase NeuD family)